MKSRLVLVATVLSLAVCVAATPTQKQGFVRISDRDAELSDSISPSDTQSAREAAGQVAAFLGVVTQARLNSESSAERIEFSRDGAPAVVAFILKPNIPKFPKLAGLVGLRVLVRGQVTVVKMQPKVELVEPGQLKIVRSDLDSPAGAPSVLHEKKTQPIVTPANVSANGFHGLSSIWCWSKTKVGAALGTPVKTDKQETIESPWGKYKAQDLWYDNLAGASRICLTLEDGRLTGISAVYVQKPTPIQLKVLFGVEEQIDNRESNKSTGDNVGPGWFTGTYMDVNIGEKASGYWKDEARFPTTDGGGFSEVLFCHITSIPGKENKTYADEFGAKVGSYFVKAAWHPIVTGNR